MSTVDLTNSAEYQIPNRVLDELREVGVSEIFIDVITTPAKEAGVQRNSARIEILKYIKWSDGENKSVTDYMNFGGHYFQSLRNLEREEIPGHADLNNQKLLRYVFSQRTTGVVNL